MKKIVIPIKGRSWKDIEESVAALSLLDPAIAIVSDLLKYITLPTLPPELKSLVAEYAAAVAPFSEEQSKILQFRVYCLYTSGRIREAMYCITSLQICANKEKDEASWWLSKLGVEQYYSINYEHACKALRCALTCKDGSVLRGINGTLLLILEGDFGGALTIANQITGREDHSWKTWPALLRGTAFAGLQMYGQAIDALDSCIAVCERSDLMAQAIALRSAVLERQQNQTKNEENKNWIYDLHQKTAAAHGRVDVAHLFVLPAEFICSINPRSMIRDSQPMPGISSSEIVSALCCLIS